MLQPFIFTKNFPSKTKLIKKKSKKKGNDELIKNDQGKTIHLICHPQKGIQLYKHYYFPGSIVLSDHLSAETNTFCGYYESLMTIKRVTSLSLLEESQILEINFADIKQELTPMEFFEDRMKSLGNNDSLKFLQTLKNCLFYMGQQNANPDLNSTINEELENYKKFKFLIKNKIHEYSVNGKCFLIIFMKTDPNSPNGEVDTNQHYFSTSLLKMIYGSENYMFEILREGIPDFYNLEDNYYVNMNALFRKMFLGEPINLRVKVLASDGKISKATLDCETIGFQGKGYQEYAAFHVINFDDKNLKKFQIQADIKHEKRQDPDINNGKINEYLFNAEKFHKEFYPKKLPLNSLEENKDKVCQFKEIS